MLMTLVSFSFITIISKELDKEHFMFLWFVRIACEHIKCKLSVSRVSHREVLIPCSGSVSKTTVTT